MSENLQGILGRRTFRTLGIPGSSHKAIYSTKYALLGVGAEHTLICHTAFHITPAQCPTQGSTVIGVSEINNQL